MLTAHLFANTGGGILADFINGHSPCLAIEYDAHKCAVLRNRYPELAIAEGDCQRMDFNEWYGRLAALHAGVPCPKWSKCRHGVGSTIDMSHEVCRVARQLGVEWVFIECVPGYIEEWPSLSGKFRSIGFSLCRPIRLSSSSVGAPHFRDRLWCAAHSDNHGEPMVPIYAKALWVPEPDTTPWEADSKSLSMADGLADRWEMECSGDGQVPICAAVAWRMLGLPYERIAA